MWKAIILTAVIPLCGICLADQPAPVGPTSGTINPDELAIRAARTDYNNALASRNTEVISRYWLQDSHSVWANGELTVGHDKIVARYAKTFKSGGFLSGLRTPQRIEVIDGETPDAAEVGTWTWKMRYSGQDLTWSGRYLAMWQKVDGRWGLRSDLYVTTGCTGGSACR
jgi:ketosteroid isomerase-like protein